jgi:hypothetical protein
MWTSNEWFGSERKKLEEGLDPVNKEDEDIDNDGDVDSSDSYLHNRRKVISKAVKEDADLEEAKKPKPGHNAIVMAKNLEIIKKTIKKEEVEQIDEGNVEDHHYTLVNKNVKRRVGHGTVFKRKEAAGLYHQMQTKYAKNPSAWQSDIEVMTVGDAKKMGVPAHNFHNLAVSESVELDEISNELKAKYLDKAVQKQYDTWREPWDPKKDPKWATPGGKPKKGYYDQPHKVKARDKHDRRRGIIDKTSEKLTGRPHYSKMSTVTEPHVDGNADSWWRGKKYSTESVELDEASIITHPNDDKYHIEKTKEKKTTTKHPEGKHIYTLHYDGDKVGTIEPYSAYNEKRKPGARVVTSRTDATKYAIYFDKDKGPSKSSDMSTSARFGHKTPAGALSTAASYHDMWKKNLSEGNAENKLKKNVYTAKLGNKADVSRLNYGDKDLKPLSTRDIGSRTRLKNSVSKMLRAGRAELKHGADAGYLQTMNDFGKHIREETELDEAMKLDKVNLVHHDGNADSAKFAREYVKAHKGAYSSNGSSSEDEAANEKFHDDYDYKHTRDGFAGGGTTVYKHKKTGMKFEVDRSPNGKTFYGTDHVIKKLHESAGQIDEISKNTRSSYAKKSSAELDKDLETGELPTRKVVNRYVGLYKARAKGTDESVTESAIDDWKLKQIHKEFNGYKGMSTADILAVHKNQRKISGNYTAADAGGKLGMVSSILRSKHGDKHVDAYFALKKADVNKLNEEVDVNESITDKDTVLVHTHKMGTDTGRYGTFNVDKVSNNILHAYDHNTGKMMKFNLKANRGIGEHDNLYIKRVIK